MAEQILTSIAGHGVHIRFHQAGLHYGETIALHPLDLDMQEKRIGVIGLNGSGKSSFARLIKGLIQPTSGEITLDGLDCVKHAKALLAQVGFIFQNPANQIILPTIFEDIGLGPKAMGLKGKAVDAAVEDILARFKLSHLAHRRPHELSGGELQLAALAAVMITKPKLLIFDEPTNQLDLKNRALVQATLNGLQEQALVISHDLELIVDFDRVLVFHQGRLVFDGAAKPAIAHYRALVAALIADNADQPKTAAAALEAVDHG